MTPAAFKAMVEITATGCWAWKGARDADGYGSVYMDGRRHGAHRVAYLLFVGPIAEGGVIHHTCRNRACACPWHLEATSHFENVMRGISPPACNARKARCQHEHPFDDGNTYRRGRRRSCRACNAEAARRYRAKTATRSKAGLQDHAQQVAP